MFVLENESLKQYSTMRLGGYARYLTIAESKDDLAEAVIYAKEKKIPFVVIGDGSNVIWQDIGYDGLVVVNRIKEWKIFKEDADNLYITIGAGENWDKTVEKVVNLGYSGIEELSLIPGTVGATPIQNVGAYGREIADVLVSLEAYDSKTNKWVNIPGVECEFGYRSSRFNKKDRKRYLIASITIHVTNQPKLPPYYPALEAYFEENKITMYTPHNIRNAVIDIRKSKLPDPAIIANNGSFFTNPIVSKSKLIELREKYPMIRYWDETENKVKLSAAFLIEHAGYKNYHDKDTGMATWQNQPLVFVNEKAKSTQDLLDFKQKVCDKVFEMFGVKLEQEPEII